MAKVFKWLILIFLKYFPGRKKFSALFFNENFIRKNWINWKILNLCFHTAVNCTLNFENTLRLSVLLQVRLNDDKNYDQAKLELLKACQCSTIGEQQNLNRRPETTIFTVDTYYVRNVRVSRAKTTTITF